MYCIGTSRELDQISIVRAGSGPQTIRSGSMAVPKGGASHIMLRLSLPKGPHSDGLPSTRTLISEMPASRSASFGLR